MEQGSMVPFPVWMFVCTAILVAVQVFIGVMPTPSPESTSAWAAFGRVIVDNRWWILPALAALMLAPATGNLLWNHLNPSIKAQPAIGQTTIPSREGEFTWIRWDNAVRFLNSSSLFGVTPKRNESGLIWEGFTAGVSLESGQAGIFQIWIYGSDQGVGHYVWRGGADGVHKEYGEGHVPMKMYLDAVGKGRIREHQILSHVNTYASRTMGRYYRPLDITYKEETKGIDIYDPVSGRNVYLGTSGEMVFGPHPAADGSYSSTPGISLTYTTGSLEAKQLRFRALDVYGMPIRYANVLISSDTGYSYSQAISDDGTETVVTVPHFLPSVHITISRAGYHTLETDIDLPMDGRMPIITAVLEPWRKSPTHRLETGGNGR